MNTKTKDDSHHIGAGGGEVSSKEVASEDKKPYDNGDETYVHHGDETYVDPTEP